MTGLALQFPQRPGTPYFSRLTLNRLMRLVDPSELAVAIPLYALLL
jgi:hypothetical protein